MTFFYSLQELWMEWIEDEKKFAESEEEHDSIVKLFELAVKDYICKSKCIFVQMYLSKVIPTRDI